VEAVTTMQEILPSRPLHALGQRLRPVDASRMALFDAIPAKGRALA